MAAMENHQVSLIQPLQDVLSEAAMKEADRDLLLKLIDISIKDRKKASQAVLKE